MMLVMYWRFLLWVWLVVLVCMNTALHGRVLLFMVSHVVWEVDRAIHVLMRVLLSMRKGRSGVSHGIIAWMQRMA